MSTEKALRNLDVITLGQGRFGVRLIEPDVLPRIIGEFATRNEAEAWILRQALSDEEASIEPRVLKPGSSLDVT
jgi:hypothetical protein